MSATPSSAERGPYTVELSSIGSGGATVLSALQNVLPLSKQALAAQLFQTPSRLLENLSRELAERANLALRVAGLESQVRHQDEPFVRGDADHEVALVVKDYSRMPEVLQAVCALLGVSSHKAKEILCSSPTVLMGNISQQAVAALERRFAPLGVEVDVAITQQSRFDAFLGDCSSADRAQALQIVRSLNLTSARHGSSEADGPLLATGLSFQDAHRLWESLDRGITFPLMLLNQDFARFELRLEDASSSPQLIDFLMRTAGMPERVIPKVLSRLPLVTHPHIRHGELCAHLQTIRQLGGQASGHLLSFQMYSLVIEQLGDAESSAALFRDLANLSAEQAIDAMNALKIAGPLTGPQARWLQHELKQAGTFTRLVLR